MKDDDRRLELPEEQEPRVRTAIEYQRKTKHCDRVCARDVHVSLSTYLSGRHYFDDYFDGARFGALANDLIGADVRLSASLVGASIDSGFVPPVLYERAPDADHDRYRGFLFVRCRFSADRKSELLSEDAALARVDVGAIVDCMVRAFDAVLAELAAERAREERVKHANAVLRHLAEDVRTRAREAVRYKQRIAALEAEYEAEKQAQIVNVLRELDAELDADGEGAKFADGTPIDARSIAAAKEALAQAVKGEGLFSRASDDARVDPERVS